MPKNAKWEFENPAGLFSIERFPQAAGFYIEIRAAAFYIDTGEQLAKRALDLQARVLGWAKDTPFGPLLEAQNSVGRKVVELWTDAARRLLQIGG